MGQNLTISLPIPRLNLGPDGRLLFAARIVRMFAYGLLSVILALYLSELGISTRLIGVLLSLTLFGDTVISLWMTTATDRIGRRRMLIAGGGLMLFAGILFAMTSQFAWLLVAAIIGVISPSGNEVGPFLAIEQAALSQEIAASKRTRVFAWYNLSGAFATAIGALASGNLTSFLQKSGVAPLSSYRVILLGYAAIGVLLCVLFSRLSPAAEPVKANARTIKSRFGLHESRGIVLRLSALFAGGFIIQSIVAYWFHIRFGASLSVIGAIFFGANLLAGISALASARVAARIGLINTMVFTHIPSNILLILIPFMPSLPWAIALLLLRFSISQMDVPPRQAYTMAVVAPDERSAAAGVTGIARSIGAGISPAIAGILLSNPVFLSAPFIFGGALKIVYDLMLYRSFRKHVPRDQ